MEKIPSVHRPAQADSSLRNWLPNSFCYSNTQNSELVKEREDLLYCSLFYDVDQVYVILLQTAYLHLIKGSS